MSRRTVLSLVLLAASCLAAGALADDELDRGFANPPDAAKPWCYWWWLDSYATPEGITRDLEEMKRQGIAGALLFDAGEGKGSPVGPKFMSDAWRELFKHAVREADRLGIVLTANICNGWNAGGTWVTDAHAAKTVVFASIQVQGPAAIQQDLPKPKIWQGDFYQDIAILAYPASARPVDAPKLKDWEVKAARKYLDGPAEKLDQPDAGPVERDCDSKQIVDLTGKVNAAGRLTWDAPAGNWTVLRIGYALLGAITSCTSPNSKGVEIDFFSTAAFDMHWAETGAKMIADAGPLAGKTLQYVHDDSYEVVGPAPDRLQQNWTPQFREEFKARRGYDLFTYLPVLAGAIVDSREVSNRFLWDYRRTIADLFADGHYRRMHELAHKGGLGTHPESGGPFWPCIDALQLEGINDIPMGEFWKRAPEQPDGKVYWSDNYHICDTVRQAASAAHIYGKPVCQAEAWTSIGPNWEEDLYALKDLGDQAFCAGLTRNMLCFYVHQPRLDIKPGFQWEMAGTHFDRNVTWWDQSHAWLEYLARCQYLLQQGRFVADLCYYYGEDAPNYVPAKTHMRPALPAGYDCDTINADVLMNRISVKEGRLTLPDGMSYALLVLPERSAMSPAVLAKIKQLAEAGATIVGRQPERAPGLTDYPTCDADVQRMAQPLWSTGRVLTDRDLGKVLADRNIAPDFEYHGAAKDAKIDFIHRTTDAAEIYFVANLQSRDEKVDCTFRAIGRLPEIWDPVTGRQWKAAKWGTSHGRTTVPMKFASRQSFFIVFRRPTDATGSTSPLARNFPNLSKAGELDGTWTVAFDPKWGGPESITIDRLVDWTQRPEPGIKFYSGKAVYTKTFDLPEASRVPSALQIYLDLGKVRNVAEVRLNGKDLGVVWTAPWRVDITAAVKPTDNRLDITIVNLWPNRLIGDASLPPDKRLTVTNVQKFKPNSPLMESGLLGPVTIQVQHGQH